MVIDETVRKRAWKIWELSQTDGRYRKMLMDIRALEKEYEAAIAMLPQKQEDLVREYVSQCEAMSWRMLQIACAIMQFPDDGHE